jgi:hypothetical protein
MSTLTVPRQEQGFGVSDARTVESEPKPNWGPQALSVRNGNGFGPPDLFTVWLAITPELLCPECAIEVLCCAVEASWNFDV